MGFFLMKCFVYVLKITKISVTHTFEDIPFYFLALETYRKINLQNDVFPVGSVI